MTIIARRVLVYCLVALPFAVGVHAQGFQGTVRGIVQDPQGAIVPGATVTLTNLETRETRSQVTTSAGTFAFPNLLVSIYSVSVELAGFRKYLREDVQVEANQVVDLVARLELGEIAETVEVIGGEDLVKTTSMQLEGVTFTSREVTQLPLNDPFGDGDPISLAVLAPGVATHSGGVAGQGGSVGGSRPRQNNFVIDGVDNNEPSVTGTLTPVIQEAVGQFTLLTNQFSAEFGHSTAGQFITTTKSGTNEYHGEGWWYSQNRNLIENGTAALILHTIVHWKKNHLAYDFSERVQE